MFGLWDKMDNHTVYVHITPSCKYYVGITKQKVSRRWRNGTGYTNCTYFNLAIQKYGWNNIQHEIIASGLTKKEAENFEILLIEKLKSSDRKFGYNISNGGKGVHGFKHSEEHKKRLSEKMSGSGNHMYGIHLVGKSGSDNPMYGMKAHNRLKIECITTGEIFDSVTDGAKKYNTHRSEIKKYVDGIRKYAGKLEYGTLLHWRYI